MPSSLLRLALVVTVISAATFARADDDDQDRARQAVERGEIRPLDQVLDIARKQLPGEIVKVELEYEHGGWVYEIKILSDQGERHEVEIDAATLQVRKAD